MPQRLKAGNVIRIRGEEYEVLKVECDQDASCKDSLCCAAYLREAGNETLHPTHVLWQYDGGGAFLLRVQEPPPEDPHEAWASRARIEPSEMEVA